MKDKMELISWPAGRFSCFVLFEVDYFVIIIMRNLFMTFMYLIGSLFNLTLCAC